MQVKAQRTNSKTNVIMWLIAISDFNYSTNCLQLRSKYLKARRHQPTTNWPNLFLDLYILINSMTCSDGFCTPISIVNILERIHTYMHYANNLIIFIGRCNILFYRCRSRSQRDQLHRRQPPQQQQPDIIHRRVCVLGFRMRNGHLVVGRDVQIYSPRNCIRISCG